MSDLPDYHCPDCDDPDCLHCYCVEGTDCKPCAEFAKVEAGYQRLAADPEQAAIDYRRSIVRQQQADMFDTCTAFGISAERERIIKLLEADMEHAFGDDGKCLYTIHLREVCNCDIIALIKGEKK